jgi:hypothetical protein
MRHAPLTPEQVRNMLCFIDPYDRDLWVSILAAVKSELGTDGLDMCNQWSQQADSYNAGDFRSVWYSLKKSGFSIGTLIHHALQGGYRFADSPLPELDQQQQARLLARDKQRLQEAKEARAQSGKNKNKAAQLWYSSDRIGQPLIRYLDHRGLAAVKEQLPASLRFIPDLAYWQVDDDKPIYLGSFPAMVAAVTDLNGDVIAIHRTYLTGDGRKAPVPKVKKLLGSLNGGVIELSPLGNGETLCLTEGIETGLAVHLSTGLPVWACVSAHGLKTVQLPKSVKQVHIMADLDVSGTGERAGSELAQRLITEGRKVKLVLPPGPIPAHKKSIDWLDAYLDKRESVA